MKHEVRVICRKCDEAQIVYCMYKHMRELTDEEILNIWVNCDASPKKQGEDFIIFARAILRKAQEK